VKQINKIIEKGYLLVCLKIQAINLLYNVCRLILMTKFNDKYLF